jgi:hypothetical protein
MKESLIETFPLEGKKQPEKKKKYCKICGNIFIPRFDSSVRCVNCR